MLFELPAPEATEPRPGKIDTMAITATDASAFMDALLVL